MSKVEWLGQIRRRPIDPCEARITQQKLNQWAQTESFKSKYGGDKSVVHFTKTAFLVVGGEFWIVSAGPGLKGVWRVPALKEDFCQWSAPLSIPQLSISCDALITQGNLNQWAAANGFGQTFYFANEFGAPNLSRLGIQAGPIIVMGDKVFWTYSPVFQGYQMAQPLKANFCAWIGAGG